YARDLPRARAHGRGVPRAPERFGIHAFPDFADIVSMERGRSGTPVDAARPELRRGPIANRPIHWRRASSRFDRGVGSQPNKELVADGPHSGGSKRRAPRSACAGLSLAASQPAFDAQALSAD